jgi:Reverse transcriptase (RNA-dependent DNA polymerase)
MTIDTNDIIGSIWPINETIQAYRFLEPRKTVRSTPNDKMFTNIDQKVDTPLEKIKVGNLSVDNRRQFDTLIQEYSNIFDWYQTKMGRTNIMTHRIITEPDNYPIKTRPYPISPGESEFLEKELGHFEKLGIIEKCESPWAAPILLVKKKNGELRLVVDYRKLNAITRKDAYPLPRINELLDCLGKATIFSALDMRSGFYQIEVDPDSREKTAFVTKYRTYQYNRLPMGLCNSPATFQ